jgi:hypothetical protein
MRAHLRIYVRNETQYWPPLVRRQAGHGIFRAYLFDALRKGHCQETTMSYQLWPLYTTFYKQNEIFGLPSTHILLDNNDPIYVYCWRLDRMPPTSFHDCGEFVCADPKEYEERFLEEGKRCLEERPITVPAGISIPHIDYEFSPLLLDSDALTDEQWEVTFKFNDTAGPVRTRPLDASQRDAGLTNLDQWIFQECARHGFTGAVIRLQKPKPLPQRGAPWGVAPTV